MCWQLGLCFAEKRGLLSSIVVSTARMCFGMNKSQLLFGKEKKTAIQRDKLEKRGQLSNSQHLVVIKFLRRILGVVLLRFYQPMENKFIFHCG